MRRWWYVLALFALACDSDSGGGGDTDSGVGAAIDGEAPDTLAPDDGLDEPDVPGGECEVNEQCDGVAICHEGSCVGCLGDEDCIEGFVCEDEACVAGCRDDAGCPTGVCEVGACVDGCRDDAGCGEGQVCEGGACTGGCRDDAGCGVGAICEGAACTGGCRDDAGCASGTICDASVCAEGCRNDAGCGADQLCLGDACVFRGVGCRAPDDCGEGDTCEAMRCVPEADECAADRLEPNDADPSPVVPGAYAGLSICPGDVDLFTLHLEAGDTLTATIDLSRANGVLELAVQGGAAGAGDGDRVTLVHVADGAADLVLQVRGTDAGTRSSYALTVAVEAAAMCVETAVYPDEDGDGYGVEAGSVDQCLEPGEAVDGFAREGGDCRPGDVLAHPNAQEVCGDQVDDDCDGADQACPASMPGMRNPVWNCMGEAPANVYAWARFPDGGGYFVDNGCFIFFEGVPDEFYVMRQLDRANDDRSCEQLNGCTCPSLNGWPAYDRRMYAFTLRGAPEDCEIITLIDHGGDDQPVSNDCRKYLYQMHWYELPHSYVGRGEEAVRRRLELFPSVEVACTRDSPHANLPYQTLLNAPIELNPNFVPMGR